MTEKKLILYIADEEYARRMLRYLSGHRQPGLQIERVTEREDFWQRRKRDAGEKSLYWITDDRDGCLRDPRGMDHRILLAEENNEKRRQISFCIRADALQREILKYMEISGVPETQQGAPPTGVYVVFSPYGEEASVAAVLLTQELALYGSCAFVNMSAFPHFYERSGVAGSHSLGELFFRLEGENYEALVREACIPFGGAVRLPAVSHYRDLWDMDDVDRKRFLERLGSDCHMPYLVVHFNDIREALPAVPFATRFVLIRRENDPDASEERWLKYARTERVDGTGIVMPVTMPPNWERWITELQQTTPETWLQDREKKSFAGRLWQGEVQDGQ